jgi:type I restriction enzyme S subunit
VGELCTSLQYGYTASATSENCGPRFLRITDIQNGAVAWPDVPHCVIESDQIEKYSLHVGDIVFARTGGTVGKSFIITRVPEQSVFASYLIRLTPRREVFPKFLYHFFQSASYWEQIGLKKGGLQGNVNATTLSTLTIPLCPLNEQRRIVAKIEELFSELDKGIEALTTAREQLKAYRHSILKHAFEGKLAGKWQWKSLGDVSVVTGGLTKNPKRATLPSTMKYLRVANVYADRLELADVAEIGVTEDEYKKVRLEPGDLLVVEGNGSIEQIGRVAMWSGQLENVGHQNHLIRVRLPPGMLPRFILTFLMSPVGRDRIVRQASSTSGLHTLSISKVSALQVPVPSYEQQEEILGRLDASLSGIEKQ